MLGVTPLGAVVVLDAGVAGAGQVMNELISPLLPCQSLTRSRYSTIPTSATSSSGFGPCAVRTLYSLSRHRNCPSHSTACDTAS